MYDIRETHFRDVYGRFLWAEPIKEDFRLFNVGEEFIIDEVKYRVERIAVVDNVQHVNIEIIREDLNVMEPHL
jgi:hypothetical protein